ncbi:MAG: DUF2157 domain-containing protein [Pseudomonadales bacterium]
MSTGAEADSGRKEALQEIRRLITAHALDREELMSAWPVDSEPQRGVVSKVLGHLGGLFLFAGIAAFIAINWASLPGPARVGVTLGVGLSIFIGAVIVERSGRWPLVATPAYLAAEVLQATGMLVAFDEYGSGGDWRIAVALTGAMMSLQAIAVFRVVANSVLVFAALLFGAAAVTNVFALAEVDEIVTALALGVSITLIALGLDRQRFPWNVSLWTGFGSGLFFFGAFDLLEGEPYELLFALFTAGGIYLSVASRTRAILAMSVVSLLLYISYFTVEHFADSLGWPVALILIGIAFVGLGLLTVRFNRRYFLTS